MLVINSASVIAELLRRDLVDDLRLAVVPVLVGSGLRLFPDGVAGMADVGRELWTATPGGAITVIR